MKRIALLLVAGLMACEANGTAPLDPSAPTNLAFQLMPSGDPNVPLGILLSWDPPTDGSAVTFDVFGRSGGTTWLLRATTTSPTFHDVGVPQAQYYVAGRDEAGRETGRTAEITVDLTDRLPAPLGLTSITLNGAIHLMWQDNAVLASQGRFDHYRVYSSAYNSALGTCVEPWYFEGSTVSDGFLVGNLTNGISGCFAVSAISLDGHESTWSNARLDTPRIDAQSTLVYVSQNRPDSGAFIFNDQAAAKFGVVGATSRVDADFILNRHLDGTVWLSPGRVGSLVRAYLSTSITDLHVIDRAPATGYGSGEVQMLPGLGYVFRLDETDGTHYGAMRVQFVTQDLIVFDWSYQNGVGNAELSAGRP